MMDDIVKDFLIESEENLDQLDRELVQLESDASSKDLLGSIFRTIHSIKGSCGFLGFAHLEKVTHAGENLLSRLRDGELVLDEEITSGLLVMVDAVRQMLAAIKKSGADGDNDYAAVIEHLQKLQTIPPEAEKAAAHVADPSKLGGLLVERGQVSHEDLAAALKEQEGSRRKIGEILVAKGAASLDDVLEAQQTLELRNPHAAPETIRVGVNLLDRLMNLVGELVLARNQLLQLSQVARDAGFQVVAQRMNLIAAELQEEVMKTRMQPIGNLWKKFPRTVRDLAISCGKNVRLAMEGQDTELDRTVIEAIKDPLTHLVRNSIDHGIESPDARKKAGKDSTGLLKLRAFHEGGQVNIEITDDGAGLNLERIRQKSVERGLVSEEQAARMSDRELFHLIFLPGFSTADQVTNVSGRGVGMDVVKINVTKIGGTVDIQSTAGRGTTVKVKIPLTLAIIPALMVSSGGERFAIPQASVLELVRVENVRFNSGQNPIEKVYGVPVYRLRGRLLPLLELNRELGLAPGKPGASESATNIAVTNIVVLQADGREFGLIVDQITDTEEIVVKPLGSQLKGIAAYSGATIMGDGRVALILDILGLAQRARILPDSPDAALNEKQAREQDEPGIEEKTSGRQSLLVVECGESGRMAIPLSLVARLEELLDTAIEFAGTQEVTQYRGEIIPLIHLSRFFGMSEPANRNARMPVVVYSEGGRSVGLVVDRIIDIVDEKLGLQNPSPRRGILGSSVIQKRVTDMLDVPGVVHNAIPGLAEAAAGRR